MKYYDIAHYRFHRLQDGLMEFKVLFGIPSVGLTIMLHPIIEPPLRKMSECCPSKQNLIFKMALKIELIPFFLYCCCTFLQIEQLQSHLQQEKSMRLMLEKAMGRASSTLSPGHRHVASQVFLPFRICD